ncbi:YibE/F family protein [Oryzobacter telluris]|uniref:YibE/F family protein n=1 Tax=Oryzobacter telluris TaxID=3149179 RepID=UPI00370D9B42
MPTRARAVLLGALVAFGVATLVGLVVLWPDAATVQKVGAGLEYAAPGVTFPHAEIIKVDPTCPDELSPSDPSSSAPARACVLVTARLTTGPTRSEDVKVPLQGPIASANLGPGDSVQLLQVPGGGGEPPSFTFVGVDRAGDLGWYALAFVLVVALVARLRGLLAIVGLVFSGLVIARFMLPALLTGEAGVAVALVTASAIMFVVLYLAHGVSVRTSTALAGTLGGILLTAAIAAAAVSTSHLSGVSDETGDLLSGYVGGLDFPSLLMGAIVIAGLGVLNDVTITQSSAVWELRGAAPELTRTEIFRSAMRIGRDHIASTIYTIVFAYAGAALSVLLLVYLYQLPLLDLLGTEDIATEVARTLCSGIGLVLAVPLTTAIAAATVTGARVAAVADGEEPPPRTRSSRHR